ncbi:hypothetical protein [Kutzneria sp. CA-103260]|uniref:hypothetical protein n=1 Tax=Kutzneria sp. CA-103260 TaxID=2802641 RepID=UPI001BA6F224|nr:hypothetical protein [Kutzneria sp. CA-103260]
MDETHNLNLATRSGAEVSDQLKHFAEQQPVTSAYVGIEVEAQGLFAGVRGRQIAGRFTLISSSSFAYGTAEQRAAWQPLVATLESLLRLHRHQPGTLDRLADYLYERTDGMIGSLSQLIGGAAILAAETRSKSPARCWTWFRSTSRPPAAPPGGASAQPSRPRTPPARASPDDR